MGTSSDHYDDELQDALDGRLDAQARAKLEAHLAACPSCRHHFESLGWLKQQLARLAEVEPLPGSLATSVARALDAEDGQAAARRSTLSARVRRWRPALAWSVGAMAALLLVFLDAGRSPDLPSAVARDYRDYRSGALPLALETADVSRMERFFSQEGVPFQTRVFDLAMMKHRLVGGRVHRLAGRLSALFVYRSEDGHRVVCQMYMGQPEELPAPAERREHDGIVFFVYRTEGLTVVFWQEGEVICVLAGEREGEAVIQLAFAKAMKVARVQPPSRLAHPALNARQPEVL